MAMFVAVLFTIARKWKKHSVGNENFVHTHNGILASFKEK